MLGKIVGAAIGFATMGPFGLLAGGVVGHIFDLGRSQLNAQFSPEERARVEQAMFQALFPLLGYLAKADGRVSEEEIQSTEELIRRMGLDEQMRKEAIRLFSVGKSDDFDLDGCLAEFSQVCGQRNDVKRIFIVYLITLALADGQFDQAEERVLEDVAAKINFSSFAFNQLIGMVRAQMAFRQRQGENSSGYQYYQSHQGAGASAYSSADELKLAYQAIGVGKEASDTEIKKAYRKLMSENHPDKLAGQGVPEEMIKLATERSQEIQTAYDLIKKHRKGG